MNHHKYLVAASAPDMDAKIAKRFGHAEYHLIVDPETLEFESATGSGEDQPSQGVYRFRDKGINKVIVGNIGPGAYNQVKAVGLEIFSCIGMTVRDAVDKVHKGEVRPLDAPTMKVSIHEGMKNGIGGGRGQGKKHGGGGRY